MGWVVGEELARRTHSVVILCLGLVNLWKNSNQATGGKNLCSVRLFCLIYMWSSRLTLIDIIVVKRDTFCSISALVRMEKGVCETCIMYHWKDTCTTGLVLVEIHFAKVLHKLKMKALVGTEWFDYRIWACLARGVLCCEKNRITFGKNVHEFEAVAETVLAQRTG